MNRSAMVFDDLRHLWVAARAAGGNTWSV